MRKPAFIAAAVTLPASDIDRARSFTRGPRTHRRGGLVRVLYRAGSRQPFVYPSEFAGSNRASAASLEVSDIEATPG